MKRSIALAKLLEVEADEIEQSSYDDKVFEYGREEYLVLTDSEADARVKESIEQSVWAFNKSFLNGHSKAIANFPDKVFSALQEQCESANEAIKAMIDDFDYFVEDAVATDGRGHFLSGYDGEERESGKYFIYRIN